MKKTSFSMVVCCLFLIYCAFPIRSAYSAGGKDPLLDLLPDNTLFCVRINNFTASMELLDQYLAGASPMPVSMTFNMFLGGALGNPMMTGVNKYGTIAFVGLTSKDQPQPVMVFLLPITDPKPFTANPACQGPDENGLYTIASSGSPTGPMVFVPIENNSYLLVGPESQKAALQSAQILFKDKKKSLAQRANPVDTQNASSAPAWAWLNMETGYELLAPILHKGLEEGQKQAQTQQVGLFGNDPNNMRALMDGFDQWMRQTDSLSIILTPQADLLTAEFNFMPKPVTELASMLVRDPAMKSGFKMGGYLDPQAQISGLMNMNKPLWSKINQKFIELFLTAADPAEDSAELTAQFKTMLEKGMKAMGSEAAFSFGYGAGTPPFTMREVVEINDAKAMRELIKESTGMVNKLYGKMGVPATFGFKEKVSEYKGVSIDQAVVDFTFPDTASPQEKAAIETMYGKDGLTYPFAVTDKAVFMAMGPQSDAEIKKLLDLRSGLPAAPSDIQTAMKIIPRAETADMVMSLNVIRLMKGMSEMMATMAQAAGQQEAPVPPFAQMLEGIAMNTQSTMAVGTRVEQGRIQTHLALPKQHLMEIMAVVMQIQQKVMMQQMQQQMQQQSQPASPGMN